MLAGEERFELSISRVRAERFKPGLATPPAFWQRWHRQTLGEVDGSRTHLVLIDSEVPLPLGPHSVNLVSRSGLEPESERS